MGELEELVESTVKIPAVPKALLRLQQIVADPNSSLADAVKVVEEDPGLATNCLKMASSAVYGLRVPRPTLAAAAAVIGLRKLGDLAVQTSLAAHYSQLQKQHHFDLDRFWSHSTLTAVAAREIARRSRFFKATEVDATGACGLLHNIGRLVMLETFKGNYLAVILPVGGRGAAALEAEREAFGFDHAAVGALLAARWNLPQDVTSVTKLHHCKPTDLPTLPQLVGFASALAHALLEVGESAGRALFDEAAARPYALAPGAAEDVISAVTGNVGSRASARA